MTKKDEPIQIWDGVWYATPFGKPPHTLECCDCGLVHDIEYKVENGRMWERLTVNKKETNAARKRRGIAKPVENPPTWRRKAKSA